MLLAHAPLSPLKRLLGVFLIGVVVRRRVNRRPRKPSEHSFVAVGAASGLGSALLGSVGPLTAPFFLAIGLARAAYIGTEAAGAWVGKTLVTRISDRVFVLLVEIGLIASGALFLAGF